MGRKNSNAAKRKITLPANTTLVYNPGLDTNDDVLVRYMGEYDPFDNTLLVWHPEGFEMWTHIGHLNRFNKVLVAA